MSNEHEAKKSSEEDPAQAHAPQPEAAPGKTARDHTMKSPLKGLKTSFDLTESDLGVKEDVKAAYFKFKPTAAVKGTIEAQDVDAEGHGEGSALQVGPAVSGKGAGVKMDVTLGEQKFKRDLLSAHIDGKLKEKMSFRLGSDKLDVSVGAEARFAWEKIPWLKAGGDATFKFVSVKWSDLAKDPNKVKVLAAEATSVLAGEGLIEDTVFNSGGYKVSLQGSMGMSASPDWAKIGGEVAKQAAEKGAQTAAEGATTAGAGTAGAGATTGAAGAGSATTAAGATEGATLSGSAAATTEGGVVATAAGATAGEGLVFSGAATAAGIAAIAVPLAAGALMVVGALQEEKNMRASSAAMDSGVKMRNYVRGYMKAYLTTLSGGNADGQGALDANAKVMAAMATTKKDRTGACADLLAANGGRAKIEHDIMKQTLDLCFDKACAQWEQAHHGEFGLLEKMGETWGMRGSFRRDLRTVLYADQFDG